MADVINLNKARKAKAKAGDKRAAVENRAKFGRSGADRSLEAARKSKAEQTLDGAKLTPEE